MQCYLSLQLKLNWLLNSKCIFLHLKFLTSCLHFTIPGLKITSMVFRLNTQYLSMLSQILAWFKAQATLRKKIWKLWKIPLRYTLQGKRPLPQNPKHINVCLAQTSPEFMAPVFGFFPSAYFLQRTFSPTHWTPHFLFHCPTTFMWSDKRWRERLATKDFTLSKIIFPSVACIHTCYIKTESQKFSLFRHLIIWKMW